jgi:hypothetical protein
VSVNRRSFLSAMAFLPFWRAPNPPLVVSLARFHPVHNHPLNGLEIRLEAIQASHLPQILSIRPFASLGEATAARNAGAETQLLMGTMRAFPPLGGLLELRSWRAPDPLQLEVQHQRLAALLPRYGLSPVLSASTIGGGDLQEFVYLIPFQQLAARASAWSALAADQEWIELRQQCRTSVSRIALYRSTSQQY